MPKARMPRRDRRSDLKIAEVEVGLDARDQQARQETVDVGDDLHGHQQADEIPAAPLYADGARNGLCKAVLGKHRRPVIVSLT
jgi:hypothetical protein